MAFADAESTRQRLRLHGWCLIPPAMATVPTDMLATLGPVLPTPQTGANHHDLKAYNRDSAPPASMSAITGTEAQPMHTDAAYYHLPPHFIALQCLEPGEAYCPTQVWR